MNLYEQSLAIHTISLNNGKYSAEAANILNLMGVICMNRGDDVISLNHFERSLKIYI